MKNKILMALATTAAVLAMVLVFAFPVLAGGPQSWNLDSHQDADVLSPPSLCQMERTSGPGDNGQSGNIILNSNGSQIWIADEKATGTFTFGGGGGAWVLELVTDATWQTDGTDCIVEIGEWNGTVFRKFLSAVQDNPPDVFPYPPNQLIITYVFQSFNEVVNKNCYLAIRVTNLDSKAHTIYCGEEELSSCLTSPGTNPGYPNPPPTPPPVPASSSVGIGILIGSIGLLSIIILKGRSLRVLS